MALPPSLPFEQLPAEGHAALEDASGKNKKAGVKPHMVYSGICRKGYLMSIKNEQQQGYDKMSSHTQKKQQHACEALR